MAEMDDVDRKLFVAMGIEEPGEPPGDPGPADAACGVCGDEMPGPVTRCPVCDTPFHHECWDYNEGCAVYACGGGLLLVRERVADTLHLPAPRRRPEELQAALEEEMESRPWRERLAGSSPSSLRVSALVALCAVAAMDVFGLSRPVYETPVIGLVYTVFQRFVIAMAGLVMLFAEGLIHSAGAQLRAARPRKLISLRDDSTREFEARLKADPKDREALQTLGLLYFAGKRWKEAREIFERLLGLEPDNPGALFRLAKTLENLGDQATARTHLTRLAALDRRLPFVKTAAARLEVLDREAHFRRVEEAERRGR